MCTDPVRWPTGTIWTQQIIISICESDGALQEYPNNLEQMPWLEYTEGRADYALRPSPRLFSSHLTPALMPPGLRDKKAKVSSPRSVNTHWNKVVCVCVNLWVRLFVLVSDDLRDAESKGQHRLLFPLQQQLWRPGDPQELRGLLWAVSDRKWWGTWRTKNQQKHWGKCFILFWKKENIDNTCTCLWTLIYFHNLLNKKNVHNRWKCKRISFEK